MVLNLNKNQRKFFIEAIAHFGDNSNDVRLKDLKEFADNNDLIVPVSALKNHCQEEDGVRGHYNLLLSGITPLEPEPKPDTNPRPMGVFRTTEDVIMDTSSYADGPPPKVKKHAPKKFVPEKNQKPLKWKNPVYVVSNMEGAVISVHHSPHTAFEKRLQVLHDNGLMSYDDYEARLKYIGGAIIESNNSQLTCLIEIKEVES